MKKVFLTFFLCMLTAATLTVSARAAKDIRKVGLRYGSEALASASLENDAGSGFGLGWFDEDARDFHEMAHVEAERLTISARGGGAEVLSADTGEVLFRFDGSGGRALGIMPDGGGEKARTWFDGCRWYGGFEFRRSGSKLSVINVVPMEDYVKGVLPYEMSADWPLEALKAQAVCARTYALLPSRHSGGEGFDVCNTTCCQVYRGVDQASALSDRAVEETAGVTAMYGGTYAETYYCSANGGASESSENVWSNPQPYLVGKEDPYERLTGIPDYSYTIAYSWSQLTELLRSQGHRIGTVTSARMTKTSPTGNAAEITFRDASGRTVVLTKQDCRWTLGAKSMRFTITGGGESWFVTGGAAALTSLGGVYAVTGTGVTAALPGGEAYAVTASGTAALRRSGAASGITITGTGWGHGVGMSQYGAKAMAEQGYTYEDILLFYYTGITLEKAGQ